VEEVRPGRSLWVATQSAAGDGELAAKDVVALLVHGSCANALQVRSRLCKAQRRSSALLPKASAPVSLATRLTIWHILMSGPSTPPQGPR